MANDLKLYGGEYYLSLYDTTNGWFHFDLAVSAILDEKPKYNTTVEQQKRVYEVVKSVQIKVNEASQGVVDDLRGRKGTKQAIYLVGLDHALVLADVYIVTFVKRQSKGHELTIEASTNIEDDIKHETNLCVNSGMENYTGSLADNWNVAGTTQNYSIDASFRTGFCQVMEFDVGVGDEFYSSNIPMPIRNGQRITASAYIEADTINSSDVDILLKLELIDDDGSAVLQTLTSSEMNLDPGDSGRISVSGTASLSSGNCSFLKLSVYLGSTSNAGTLNMDDFQIEIGNLSTYKDN